MYSFSDRVTAGSKAHSSKSFFGGNISELSFFPPIIQRQPKEPGETKSYAEETIELGKQIQQNLEEGKQSLCALAIELIKSSLNPDTAIGATTQDAIDAYSNFATSCSGLAPHIRTSVPPIKGHYNVYKHYRGYDDPKSSRFWNDDWHQAVKKYLNTKDAKEVAKVGGFFNRDDRSINLPSDAKTGNALHEATHRMSQPAFRENFGQYLNEGVTQYFTDYFFRELQLPVFTGHDYKDQLHDATVLAERVSDELLAKMYFGANQTAQTQAMIKLGIIKNDEDPYFYGEVDVLKAIGSRYRP